MPAEHCPGGVNSELHGCEASERKDHCGETPKVYLNTMKSTKIVTQTCLTAVIQYAAVAGHALHSIICDLISLANVQEREHGVASVAWDVHIPPSASAMEH